MNYIKSTLFLAFYLILSTSISAQIETKLEHLDQYYENSFQEWNIPGMAIALVKDGKMIYQKGFGFADLEKKSEVDEHTLFAIASNTKAFTSTALAMLVEEGKLDWQDKVQKYLPYFELYDPYVSRNMTIEDLLCHRSGLSTFSGDLLWYGTDKSAKEVVKAAKGLDASYGFRTKYGYSNVMYITAGLIIEKISGKSYPDFIKERILQALNMERSICSTNELDRLENIATPYYYENGKNNKLYWLNWDNIAAAGGIISSVSDMANWLILNTYRGQFREKTLISDNSFEKLSTPHISFQLGANSRKNTPSKHFAAYGLGWSLKDQYGKKIIAHGGGYDGMISRTFVVPEEKLGMVILTNNLNYLPGALMEKTLDVMLGDNLDGADYSKLYLGSYKNNLKEVEKREKETNDQKGKINSNHLALESYTGTYIDQMYGAVEVTKEDENIFFQMLPTDIFYASLEHWNDHIFTFQFPKDKSSLPGGKLWFEVDKNGKVNKLFIDVINPDFDFGEFEFIKK